MPDPTKQQAAVQIRTAIDTALWVGLTAEQIQAIVSAWIGVDSLACLLRASQPS